VTAAILAAALVAVALLGLRRRAHTLRARRAAVVAPKPVGETLTMGQKLALAGVQDGPTEPLFDSVSIGGERVTLLRDGLPAGMMTLKAWRLLEREAEEWERARSLAVKAHTLRPVPPPAARPDRCPTCSGKTYSPKPLGNGLCSAAFHATRAA